MREFFKPWWRKLGIVTLLMACVAAGAWVARYHRVDAVELSIRESLISASSGYGAVLVTLVTFSTRDGELSAGLTRCTPSSWANIGWDSSEVSKPWEEIEPWKDAQTESHRILGPFICGTASFPTGNQQFDKCYVLVPSWSITVSLTFMSLWLLILKPRKTVPMQVSDPLRPNGVHT